MDGGADAPAATPVLSQGTTWTWRNPRPQGNDLNASAYGNGTYVALGSSGTVLTSKDGVAWTVQRLDIDHAPMSFDNVVFGAGLFVVSGSGPNRNDAILATSPDGMNWTLRAVVPRPCRLARGTDRFVCVGGFVATSSDGIAWATHASAPDLAVRDLAFGAGTFVAVGTKSAPSAGGAIATSTDGVSWTTRKSTINRAGLNAVVFAQGRFVATGAERALETSTDGVSWNSGTLGADGSVGVSLSHGNGTFVAVVENAMSVGATIMTSPDGATWSASTGSYPHLRVVHGDAGFLAVGTHGSILSSVDGVTWAWRSSGPTTNAVRGLEAVVHGSNKFVATGNRNIVTSADGVTWTQTASDAAFLYGLAHANGTFVAVGSSVDRLSTAIGNGVAMSSTDGATWTTKSLDEGLVLEGVTFGAAKYIAVGSRSGIGRVLSSTDGVSWTEAHAGNQKLSGVTYANGQFVAVGSPDVLASPDGVAWTPRKIPDGPALASVAFGNGVFVAVAAPYFIGGIPGGSQSSEGRVLTSSDGITWTKASDLGATSIAFVNGEFIAVGSSTTTGGAGFVTTSRDGATWGPRTQLYQSGLNALAHGNGEVVTVGYFGAILSRPAL